MSTFKKDRQAGLIEDLSSFNIENVHWPIRCEGGVNPRQVSTVIVVGQDIHNNGLIIGNLSYNKRN